MLFFCFACSNEQDMASNSEASENVPEQEGWNATLTMSNHGELTSQIQYVRMLRFSNKKETRFSDGVTFSFYEDGAKISQIETKEAVLDERTNDIQFMGDVRVTTDDGLSVFTDTLFWQHGSERITSEAFVTVVTADSDTINGTGFESGKSFRNWVIRKPYGVTQKRLNISKDDGK